MQCSRIAHMALDSAGLGLRIAQARQRAGLKQEGLAQAASLDRSAIAKIETGTRRVTALELARIAAAVNERIEWFLEEPTPAVVSYRNMTDPGEPSPRIDAAIDRVARAVEFTAKHDHGFDEKLVSMPTFAEPLNTDQTEQLAQNARGLLRLEPDEPVHGLSAKLAVAGVLTFVLDLGTESADAGSLQLVKGAVAVVNGTLHTGRRRLALAHEFGHLLLADDYTVDWRVDTNTQRSRERAIDRFARSLLLPSAPVTERWQRWSEGPREATRSAAVRIASEFRVDMSTLARRLLDLKLADERTAAFVRSVKTTRADIVEHNLVVADELGSPELPRMYELAVLRLHNSETVSNERALDLLLGAWEPTDLPEPAPRAESEIWQFVS